jgi:copper chaperone NosL
VPPRFVTQTFAQPPGCGDWKGAMLKNAISRHRASRMDQNRSKTRYCTVLWIACCLVILGAPLFAFAGNGAPQAVKPLDGNGQMRVSPGDRCPVCGMKVIRYPKFSSAIQLRSDATYYFCSTGCMIRSWMHPEIYLGCTSADLKQPIVKEYFTGRHIDARDVIFVFGSDVIGPMGPALVPVMNAQFLDTFKRRHGGKTQFLLETLDDNKWFEITGRRLED